MVLLFIDISLDVLQIAQTVKHRTVGWLVYGKLEGVWKELVVSQFKVTHLLGGTEENKTASFWDEIWTWDLPNSKWEHWLSTRDDRCR